MRRQLLTLMMLGFLSVIHAGCATSRSTDDPLVRMEKEMIENENLGDLKRDEWRRGSSWGQDQPGHLTPYRIHGGVGPASSSI